MEKMIVDDALAQMRTALESDDLSTASSIIEALRPADQADVFSDLDDEEQNRLLPQINPADAADIFEELYDEEAAELAVQLPLSTLIRIVNEMEPDEAADLLDDMEPKQAEAVLTGLEGAHKIQHLISYPDDTAGGLMTSAYIDLGRGMTAAQAINAIRAWRPDEETIYYLFITDRLKRLVGVINLRQLIVADPATTIANFMDPDVIYVTPETDQEDCADLMLRYDLLALPVVDEEKHLLGIITIDDLVDVIQDEASEDIQRLAGAEPLDRAYLDTSIWSELQAVVALTIFIPMLIGTGGNAGSQTTATIIRALAVRDIDWDDVWRVWLHEIGIGLALGLSMGTIAYFLALTWLGTTSLALTVAASILGIVLWATGAGSLLPLLATRFKIDPTVVSGPVMSTLVDATGLLIYFNIARLILGL
jgi:magnesium transporter